eukprot:CAMPEP_0171974110 /NCGR_PEP_ID=MMETSP0993-20121228/230772_1 /TAXON_ID=483369 /ORGANISM="non described non described, Strain CCMP2098" /LENGTH=33 /DNA_ID= /DNA_START= /DNA_END= /DNA_ORIENTATION=
MERMVWYTPTGTAPCSSNSSSVAQAMETAREAK